MNTLKKLTVAALLSLMAWISVALVLAQAVQIDRGPFLQVGGRQVIRVWQDFLLRQHESARDVVVIAGSTTIAGRVEGDLVAILGPVNLESTAEIHGSLVLIAGNLTVAEGATVRRDLMVYAGASIAPTTFYPGGEHIVIGGGWMGDRLRALLPWLTRGLLWGRLIVPSLGWIWTIVAMVLIITLAINLLLHGAVGQCADAIAAKPASTFLTGLLVLLLTGPVAVLLAATVIGLAIVPFFLCAVVLGWIVGKVGVARWIGRSLLRHEPDETPLRGMLAVAVGFAGICLLYMVPIIGIATWALTGVLGLGSASLAMMSALRRERPPAVKRGDTAPGLVGPQAPAARSEEPSMSSPTAYEAYSARVVEPPHGPAAPVAAVGLAALPHATFIDRVVAGVLDVVFVLFVFNVFLDHLWFRHDADGQLLLMLAYFITFWAWKGTTLGGIVCRLRVTRVDGQPLAAADAIIRGLASLFSFVPLGIGFFWILRDSQQQAWHDKIAGTYVVKVPKDWPV